MKTFIEFSDFEPLRQIKTDLPIRTFLEYFNGACSDLLMAAADFVGQGLEVITLDKESTIFAAASRTAGDAIRAENWLLKQDLYTESDWIRDREMPTFI